MRPSHLLLLALLLPATQLLNGCSDPATAPVIDIPQPGEFFIQMTVDGIEQTQYTVMSDTLVIGIAREVVDRVFEQRDTTFSTLLYGFFRARLDGGDRLFDSSYHSMSVGGMLVERGSGMSDFPFTFVGTKQYARGVAAPGVIGVWRDGQGKEWRSDLGAARPGDTFVVDSVGVIPLTNPFSTVYRERAVGHFTATLYDSLGASRSVTNGRFAMPADQF